MAGLEAVILSPLIQRTPQMQATILFAHGSRDPSWRTPIDKVADHMRKLCPQQTVRCAFLELTQPDLLTVVAELAAMQIHHITIVPMFLGIGRHAREDLPKLVSQLRQSCPNIAFHLRPSIGEEARVIELLAHLCLPDPSPAAPTNMNHTT